MGLLGQAVPAAGFVACCLTILIGLIYLSIQWPQDLVLRWGNCPWIPDFSKYEGSPQTAWKKWSDCNTANNYVQGESSWSSFFSVIGILPAESLILGTFGAFMHQPCLFQVFGFPRNFLQYGGFMVVQALFGNFSYLGRWGVLVGWLSLSVGLLAFVAQALGEKSDRMIRLSGSRRLRDHCDCTDTALISDDSDPEGK